MANKIILDEIPNDFMIKSLGSGVSAECFLTSDNKAFKKFYGSNLGSMYKHLTTKDRHKSDIFVFPKTYVFQYNDDPDNFIGYLMEYIDGQKLSELESTTLLRDIISMVSMIEKDMKRLTYEGLMFTDLNTNNIIFKKDKTPKIVDTDLYESTYDDFFGEMYRENIKELSSSIISDVIRGGFTESHDLNGYILDSLVHGSVLPSNVLEEVMLYIKSKTGIDVKTYEEYKNGLKLIKKK